MLLRYTCNDCPRNCNKIRTNTHGEGYCRAGALPQIAKIMRHKWEEPCISGTKGAGNIFFAGCNLKCIYCQNHDITLNHNYSNSDYTTYSSQDLSQLFLQIAEEDYHNINLVTADCYLRIISAALSPAVKEKINKPIILNCSGYNKPEIIETLKGKIDIFLPDFKYSRSDVAKKYSNASDYPEVAKNAIKKMFEITGPCKFDQNGILLKGVIIRHLILPGNLYNTFEVIDWVNETFNDGEVIFSLMSQYTPCETGWIGNCVELNRKITSYEKRKAEDYLLNTKITSAYVQDESSAENFYIPDFK